jgi:ferredoxin-nitrite reductase
VLGVHKQKQEGLNWVGASVPSGRITAEDMEEFARIADTYGDGTARLTPEENILFVNIPDDKLQAMLAEPLFQKFKVNPGNLERGLVSCTGSQFCGFGLIETKQRAMQIVAQLEASMSIPKPVRIHWTGCPNSCGQAQVADIGLMGGPAKLNGKAVEGVKIFLGGKVGEDPALASEIEAGVPCHEDYLLPKLKDLLVQHFGATPLAAV